MNRVFKVVWNKSMNRWDVTSEIGSSRKKAKRSTMSKVAVSVIAGALALGGVAMAEEAKSDVPLLIAGEVIGDGQVKKLEMNNLTEGDGYKSAYGEEGKPAEGLTTKNIKIDEVVFNDAKTLEIKSANLDRTIEIGKMTSTAPANPIKLTLDGNIAAENAPEDAKQVEIESNADLAKLKGTAKLTADVGDAKTPAAAAEIAIKGFKTVETQNINASGAAKINFENSNTVTTKDITVTDAAAAGDDANIGFNNINTLNTGALSVAGNNAEVKKALEITDVAKGDIKSISLTGGAEGTIEAKADKLESNITIGDVTVGAKKDAAGKVLTAGSTLTATGKNLSLEMGNVKVEGAIDATIVKPSELKIGGDAQGAIKSLTMGNLDVVDGKAEIYANNLTAKDVTVGVSGAAGTAGTATLNIENTVGSIDSLTLAGEQTKDTTAQGTTTIIDGKGGSATVTSSKLTVNNDVNVKDGGMFEVKAAEKGKTSIVDIKGDLNIAGVQAATPTNISQVTLTGAADQPGQGNVEQEAVDLSGAAVLNANNVSITGGAALTVGKYADLSAKEITVDGANKDDSKKSTLTVDSSEKDSTSTLTAESIAVANGAQFDVGNTSGKATVTVDGDITLTNGAAMDVKASAMTKDEKDNVSLNITADKLVLTNGEVDGEKEGEKVAGKQSKVTLNGVDGKNLDLTSINEVVIDGGKIENLDKAATVNMNAVTFTHADGGEFTVKDLTLNEGESSLAVGLDDAKAKEGQTLAKLSIEKLTINGGNTTLKAADLAKVEVAEKAEAAKPVITSTFKTQADKSVITVNDGGMLTLEGNANFEFVKPEEKPEEKASGEVKPELQLTAGMDHTQAVLKVESPIDVKAGGALAGSGYVSNLTMGRASDLYVGNAFKNANLGNVVEEGEADAATRTAGATYGHLAVNNLEFTGKGNIHFSLAEGGNEADRLTILESAHGDAAVFISPVMSNALTGDANGEVLLVDASNIEIKKNNTLELTKGNDVSRGLFEYDLVKREGSVEDGALGTGAQWYLTSNWAPEPEAPSEPEGDGGNTGGENAGGGNTDGGNTSKPVAPVHKYTVEPNAYLTNLVTSNKMFALSFEDRQYLSDGNGLWTNIGGSFGKLKGDVTKDQIDSKVNYVTFRIGKDLVSTNEYTAGLMAAYGHASGHSDSNVTGRRADSKVDGFALGAYGTFYFDEAGYVDAWAQYVHTRNKVEGNGRPTEKYNANGLLASIEVGNAFKLSDTVTVVPQGQITYMGVKAKDHWSVDGVKYGSSRGNVQFRLGATLYGTGVMESGTPYVGVNYFHNTSNNKVKIQDTLGGNHDLSLTGGKNLFQLKVGSDFKIDNHSRIGGEVSHTFGKDSYRDTKVDVNYRYDF